MPSTAHLIIYITLSLVSAALMYLCSYKMLQIIQMSSYRNSEFFDWLKKTKFQYFSRYFSLSFFILVPTLLFIVCFGRFEYISYLGYSFFILLSVLFYTVTRRQVKVALKLTPRLKRLSILMLILYTVLAFPLVYLTNCFYLQYALVGILPLLIPMVSMLANWLILPCENAINNHYKKQAAKKLQSMPSLIKIGITGSYGKTTAKNILSKMLSTKYKVLASPKSYNTPMGLAKVINQNLCGNEQIFIAEMGARYCGDIKELCDFIHPRIGVLTAIGDMHLETFKSKENLIKTKYELIDSLPSDGLAVFSGSNEILRSLYNSCGKNKLITLDPQSAIKSIYFQPKTDENGTSFVLNLDEEVLQINTKLLGNHIPELVSLCALTAYKLGVSGQQIVEACKELEDVPHRLQLIRNGNTTIIDDAYNSNPEGANNALLLLQSFLGTKIIVTPGMVELGEISDSAHFELGNKIAEVCDYAILVGKNAPKIEKGIAANGRLGEQRIIIVNTLFEATVALGKIDSDKKVVLFENDLPDNYIITE